MSHQLASRFAKQKPFLVIEHPVLRHKMRHTVYMKNIDERGYK